MSDQNRNDMLDTMVGVSRAEMDEILRLRETLGAEVWDEMQRTHWNEYHASRSPSSPGAGIWSAFLTTLRAAVEP